MSEQTKLDVSIPLEVATSRLMNRQFLTHVRRLMHHLSGQNISGSSEEDRIFFMEAIFPDRQKAVDAAIAIRSLSLGHTGKSAKDFWYTIDDDEMLLFKNNGDLLRPCDRYRCAHEKETSLSITCRNSSHYERDNTCVSY